LQRKQVPRRTPVYNYKATNASSGTRPLLSIALRRGYDHRSFL